MTQLQALQVSQVLVQVLQVLQGQLQVLQGPRTGARAVCVCVCVCVCVEGVGGVVGFSICTFVLVKQVH